VTSASAQDITRRWRAPMLRYARLHLHCAEDAEDAVQEALAALLAQPPAQWPADPRPYLFGILKHKITDQLRDRGRHGEPQAPEEDDTLDQTLFNARGKWAAGQSVARWHLPDAQLHTAQFFALVEACTERLPPKPARVFSLRVLLEWEAEAICDTLGLSRADYWQCLSRARKQLQLCLATRGFGAEGAV